MAKPKRVTKLKDRRVTPPAPRLAEGRTADPERAVRLAIAQELDLTVAEVTGDEHLHLDLGMDDDQLPQVLARMGEALDVRFPDDFFDGVHTVAQLTAAVRVSLSPL